LRRLRWDFPPVPGLLWGTGRHDWAEVTEPLVRLSCGSLGGAEVVGADGYVMPASGFERLPGGGNVGIVFRFGIVLYPVPAILGGLRNQHVRPAR
jgi:hypothetical protein